MSIESPQIDLYRDRLVANGHSFVNRVPLLQYFCALGPPDHEFTGATPAPIGHRNNHQHIFRSGVVLLDHHENLLIQAAMVLFNPHQSAAMHGRPEDWKYSFRGSIRIEDVPVNPADPIEVLLEQLPVAFVPHLGYSWFLDSETSSITIDTYKLNPHKRKSPRLISAIWYSFRKETAQRLP